MNISAFVIRLRKEAGGLDEVAQGVVEALHVAGGEAAGPGHHLLGDALAEAGGGVDALWQEGDVHQAAVQVGAAALNEAALPQVVHQGGDVGLGDAQGGAQAADGHGAIRQDAEDLDVGKGHAELLGDGVQPDKALGQQGQRLVQIVGDGLQQGGIFSPVLGHGCGSPYKLV